MTMAKTMTRGKQQVLLNHLPGKTFDFQGGPIARVASIRGYPNANINESIVLRRVSAQAHAWRSDLRPALSDTTLNTPGRFVLLDPLEVEAEMFPKVFQCQNCNRIIDYSTRNGVPAQRCPACSEGKLAQMRFVKIHRCGALEPLVPPSCPQCKSRKIGLSMRGSEKFQLFVEVCAECGNAFALFGGNCRHCDWPTTPSNTRIKTMDIEVHRAGRTYYPQSCVLINIPYKELEGLFANHQWPLVVASKFLGISEFVDKPLTNFGTTSPEVSAGLSNKDLDSIFATGLSEQQILEQVRKIREAREKPATNGYDQVCDLTGVAANVWGRVEPKFSKRSILSKTLSQDLSHAFRIEEVVLSLSTN